MPLVTWNMPVRNAMPYLPEALESIANQTFRNAEILAWDNGSTDGSADVLKEWIPHRIPGRVVLHCPLPLAECRARMVEESPAKFIALHDADDRSLPERLERQISTLTSRHDLVAVGVQESAINANGEPIPLPPQLLMEVDFVGTLHAMMIGFPLVHPSGVYSREAVLKVGNYRSIDNVNHVGEDVDLMMRLAAIGSLESLPEQLYTYRFHGASTSQNLVSAELGQQCMNQMFARNAGDLYGWTPEQALNLRELRVDFSFPLLRGAARAIEKRSGVPVRDQARRRSWARVVSRLSKRKDFLSRWFWKLLAI